MITTTSFKAIIEAQRRHPTEWLWRQCLSIRSQFCEAVVAAGYLSWEQMVSAACRYRLGASRQGGVIFWQIDQEERVRDGKVMYYGLDCHRLKDKQHHPTWVSTLLRRRDPFPNSPHETSHCFFGAHLLTTLNERLFRPPLTPPNLGGETAIAVISPLNERLFRPPLTPPNLGGETAIAVITPLNERLFRPPLTPPNSGGETAIAVITPLNERLFRPPLTPPRSSFARLLPKGRKNSGGETASAVITPLHHREGQGGRSPICVVEAEKTAFILSERYPQYVWLAAGGLGEVQVDKFRPLRGRRVILFPDTDPEGMAYRRWYEAAQMVMQQPFWEDSPPIRVSTILEQHASAEQKARKIDLVDFLFDRRTD